MNDNELKRQLSELMHEIMLMNKSILEKGDYLNLLSLCEKDITILACLGQQENLTAKEVSRICDMPKTTVITAVNRLVERGYIHRIQNAKDKREMFLILTERGQKANREHLEYEELILDALMKRWEKDDQITLAKILSKRVKII